MGYVIRVSDIKKIMIENKKTILAFSVIFAMLLGSIGFIKASNIGMSNEEKAEKNKAAKNYEKWFEGKTFTQSNVDNDTIKAYEIIISNPVMKLDFSNCKVIQIVFAFDEDISRRLTVKSWINELSEKELFQKENQLLEKYRDEYIAVDGDKGEVLVTVLDSDQYDMNRVADLIVEQVNEKAKSNSIHISKESKNVVKGFNQTIFDRQDAVRNIVFRLQSEASALKSDSKAVETGTEGNGFYKYKIAAIFGFAGIVIGIIFALLLLLFRITKNGVIICSDQIENFFEIEKISNISSEKKDGFVLTDVVVDALCDDENGVMIMTKEKSELYENAVTIINDVSNRQYYYTLVENSIDFINEVKHIKYVIVPVTLRKTKYSDIQSVIKWSNRFNIKMLGYIIFEQ